MSPPCIPTIFEGDNGGATSRGVSATEIRVAVPTDVGFTTQTGAQPQAWRAGVTAMFEYFNRHYELYGRRLVPVLVEGQASNAITSRAQGAAIAAQSVFGAVTGWHEVWWTPQAGLVQELARSGIVTVTRNGGSVWTDRQMFDSFHPYIWSVYPSAETNLAQFGDFACGSLAGRKATHAAEPALRDRTRRFGVVALGQEATPVTSLLVDKLSACGEPPVVVQSTLTGDPTKVALRAGWQRMVSAGVTTVVCVCEGRTGFSGAVVDASNTGLNPEWLIGSANTYSEEYYAQSYWTGRNVSVIKLDAGPKLIPVQSRPWFWAMLETDNALATGSGMQLSFQVVPSLYENLLILASGIQAAGPQLTPETFAAGLMGLRFPNPGAGQTPYWQPSGGFGPGDHALYDDYAVAWWSATAPSLDPFFPKPQGSWCYAGAGARFRANGYTPPLDAQVFDANQPCR